MPNHSVVIIILVPSLLDVDSEPGAQPGTAELLSYLKTDNMYKGLTKSPDWLAKLLFL